MKYRTVTHILTKDWDGTGPAYVLLHPYEYGSWTTDKAAALDEAKQKTLLDGFTWVEDENRERITE